MAFAASVRDIRRYVEAPAIGRSGQGDSLATEDITAWLGPAGPPGFGRTRLGGHLTQWLPQTRTSPAARRHCLAERADPYTIEEFTAGDGYRWRYRRFLPSGAPQAEVVFVHGIQSHGGWYERSCAELAKAGFAVSFLDRRGSGLNSQNRGDAPSFRRLLDDLAEYLTQVLLGR